MEQCPVCGRSYGVAHSCPGPVASLPARWSAPASLAPLHYFRQALAIAGLDDDAVTGASTDANAILYGTIIWIVGQVIVFIGTVMADGARVADVNWISFLLTLWLVVLVDAVLVLVQYGLCHLLARWWFGARGTYLGVLRPVLLGSVVAWLAVVPFVGSLVAGLWSIAVMMIVFEDVDGISRLKAFGLSAVIGLVFQVLMYSLLRAR